MYEKKKPVLNRKIQAGPNSDVKEYFIDSSSLCVFEMKYAMYSAFFRSLEFLMNTG